MQTGVKDITYLTPKEVKRYENEIELCKRNLLNVDRSIFASERGIEKDEIRKKIKRNEKILEERKSPGTLEKDRDKLYRRAKELEEFIKDGMPTKDEHMGKRKTNSDGKKYQEAAKLVDRARNNGIQEVIIATNPNLEGDVTAMYILEQLEPLGVKVTQLARGMPSGSYLEYANSAVIADAIHGRKPIQKD